MGQAVEKISSTEDKVFFVNKKIKNRQNIKLQKKCQFDKYS